MTKQTKLSWYLGLSGSEAPGERSSLLFKKSPGPASFPLKGQATQHKIVNWLISPSEITL